MKVAVMRNADLSTWLSASPPYRDDGLPHGTLPCSGPRGNAVRNDEGRGDRNNIGYPRRKRGGGYQSFPLYMKF